MSDNETRLKWVQATYPTLRGTDLDLFLMKCDRSGLDPMASEICPVQRGTKWTIQVQIHGLRKIAEATGCYAPGKTTEFTYDDNNNLLSATAFVKKFVKDTWHEYGEIAHYDEYVQIYQGKPASLWATKPHVMLAKCAEALALRRGFPQLEALYTLDEYPAEAEGQQRPQESRAVNAQFPGERGKPAQGANTGVSAEVATETIVVQEELPPVPGTPRLASEHTQAWANVATVQKNIRTLLEALGKPKIGEIPAEWKVGAWAERLCGLPWSSKYLDDLEKLEAALQKYVDAMQAGGYEPGEEWNCAIGLAVGREVIPDSIADLNAEELPKLLAWLTRTGA